MNEKKDPDKKRRILLVTGIAIAGIAGLGLSALVLYLIGRFLQNYL